MQENVFTEIYRQFAIGIFRYIYFKVSEYELACDLTADTFTRFWKVLQREKIANKKALLFSIANGFVIDYYRKKKNQKKISLQTIDERILGFVEDNEESIAKKQEIENIFKQIKKIKKDYQDILLLYYVEELKIKEISSIIKKNENNTRVLLHRALKALKKLL